MYNFFQHSSSVWYSVILLRPQIKVDLMFIAPCIIVIAEE